MRLFWGTKNPEMTPYKDIIPKWEALGVQVVSVYSADGNGYVQDVFEQVLMKLHPHKPSSCEFAAYKCILCMHQSSFWCSLRANWEVLLTLALEV